MTATPLVLAPIDSISRPIQNLIAAALVAFMITLGALSVQRVSITADEYYHLKYGQNILSLRPRRFDDSKMPVTALNALPGKIAAHLPAGAARDFMASLLAARLVTVVFSGCVASIVFHWSRALYGFYAGIASLLLYVFDPNLIAHSQLVTTDIYAAGFVLIVFFCLWRFARRPTLRSALMCAVVLGLSQLAKYSTVVLLPLMLLALMLHDLPAQLVAFRSEGPRSIRNYLGRLGLYIGGALVAIFVLVNAGFVFYRPFLPLADYRFTSDIFQSLKTISPLRQLPVPFPYPYLQGLDLVTARERLGWRVYLLGQLRIGSGFPGYYFVASALKTPIATQVVVIAALVIYLCSRQRRNGILQTEVFLLLPIAFYTLYLNFFFKSQLGIRFYLIVFPLLYVFAGSMFSKWLEFSKGRKAGSYLLLVYLVASVLSYYPFYLAYFNEIVWNRKYAYKYLVDSNLDWGQDQFYVDEYLAAHPQARRAPASPEAGEFIVSPTELVGVTANPKMLAWLRDNFEPASTIAYGHLVYDIRPSDLDWLCNTRALCP